MGAGAIAVSGNRVFAQITPDATLGAERSVINSGVSNGLPRDQIEGGAIRGINLFHSFHQFNIGEGQSVYFQNPAGIENIISRVTGGSPSDIRGTLGVSGGTANLFVLNPNGIIFGSNARLDVGGSFVATTANAIQFGTQGFFCSSDPNPPPLLTVNPSAFLFNQVAHGAIVNRSTVPLAANTQGLQVPDGRSLLLLGGDVSLVGGRMNAFGGRVELGGVAGAGMVGLSVDGNNLHLSFPEDVARADISLTDRAKVDASGEGGGTIQVQGRHVLLSGGSQMLASTQGAKAAGNLSVNASESVELLGLSSPFGVLTTQTFGAGSAGEITINTRKLILRDGAVVSTFTFGEGSAGQLTINASESVELIGISSQGLSSGLFNTTVAAGDAGNLIINTRKLIVQGGAVISTESTVSKDRRSGQVIRRATGRGGQVIVNASESVELTEAGQIFTDTRGSGDAGNLTINTGRLLVQSGSTISAQSRGLGNAGSITVEADAIRLDNKGEIRADTSGGGGNIELRSRDLILRHGSSITTNARGSNITGGNITIDTDNLLAVPKENSDISANSDNFFGGRVIINAQGIFGTQFRDAPTPLSDITATSELGPEFNGTVQLNTPDIDPNRGLINLPTAPVNTQVSQVCQAGARQNQNSFIITGRGGLPPNPRQVLRSQAVQVDWVTLDAGANNPTGDVQSRGTQRRVSGEPAPQIDDNVNNKTTEIVEAQGWVVDANGNIVLVATAPTGNPHSPWFTPASCPVR